MIVTHPLTVKETVTCNAGKPESVFDSKTISLGLLNTILRAQERKREKEENCIYYLRHFRLVVRIERSRAQRSNVRPSKACLRKKQCHSQTPISLWGQITTIGKFNLLEK